MLGVLLSASWLRNGEREPCSVLERLASVTSKAAAAKHAALRTVREAFVFRFGSTPEQPTAAEYILDEACALALSNNVPVPVAGGEHRQCTL